MDDDIDVFAELGVDVTSPPKKEEEDLLGLLAEEPQGTHDDPLAALVEGDEADAFTVQPEVEAPSTPVQDAPRQPDAGPSHALSEDMVAQVVALLVQRGLAADPQRLGLPAGTVLDVGHVSVERDHDVLVARAEVGFNGAAMHPFAAVQLTSDGCVSLPPPKDLPSAWHPMHDVLAAALLDGTQQLDQALGGAWKRA